MAVAISHQKCLGCGMCVLFCPEYALCVPGETFQCYVDADLCTDCLICLDYCPAEAIEEP